MINEKLELLIRSLTPPEPLPRYMQHVRRYLCHQLGVDPRDIVGKDVLQFCRRLGHNALIRNVHMITKNTIHRLDSELAQYENSTDEPRPIAENKQGLPPLQE